MSESAPMDGLLDDGPAPPAHAPRILLVKTALDGHFASAHMADWQETRKGLAVTSASIKKYIISSVEDLG